MRRHRAGRLALLLTAGTGLVAGGAVALTGAAAKKAVTPAPAPAPVVAAPLSPAANFVDHAYADMLNRPASRDPNGSGWWTSQVQAGTSHMVVAANFAITADYNQKVVTEEYLDFGHRFPDPGGLAYWSNYLLHGGSVAILAGSLVGAPYITSQFGGNAGSYVNAAYQLLLGHAPDPGGLAYWTGDLARGDSMAHVAMAIANSPEFWANRVTDDYFWYHIGIPDAPGLAYWSKALASGVPERNLVVGLVSSPAYAAWGMAHP